MCLVIISTARTYLRFSPGGTAILASESYAIWKLEVPELSTREAEGRLVCAVLSTNSSPFILISLYGYPYSHHKHASNEEMFRQVASWMMSLTVPALAAGDWKESVESSLILSLLPSFGLWHLNSSRPTTHGKLRRLKLSAGLAIDHAVANSRSLDHQLAMNVTYSYVVPDHYPLQAHGYVSTHQLSPPHVDRDISLSGEWKAVRPIVLAHMRLSVLKSLAQRRPTAHGGVEGTDVKAHRKLLARSSPCHASLLMKLWGGAIMTRALRHRMNKEVSAEYDCVCAWRDTRHLLYDCPLVTRPEFFAEAWSAHPAYMSTAILLDEAATHAMRKDWEQMCKHALNTFGTTKAEAQTWDLKGHKIALDSQKRIAYCLACHVSRCVRDARYVATRTCVPSFWQCSLAEGALIWSEGQLLKVQILTWKHSGCRPALTCLKCGQSFWSTSLASPPPRCTI